MIFFIMLNCLIINASPVSIYHFVSSDDSFVFSVRVKCLISFKTCNKFSTDNTNISLLRLASEIFNFVKVLLR